VLADKLGGDDYATASADGTVTLIDDVEIEDEVTIPAGVTLELDTFALGGTGDVTNNGTIDFGTSGTITTTGTVTNNGTFSASNTTALTNALEKATSGTVEVTGTSASIAGGTVQGTATLKVSGTLEVTSATITGTAGAKIVVQGSGTITGAGATNFYYNDGTTAIASPIPAGTYTWDDGKWKSAADAPISKDAEIAGEITWEPTSIVTINYTGTAALGTINIPDNKKLIIKNAVENGDGNAITLQGSGSELEIEGPSGSIDLGTTGTITNSSSGTVTNNGTIKTAVTAIGDPFNAILAVGGNITASSITVGSPATLTVPATTNLTISSLTVTDTLIVAAIPANSTLAVTALTNSGTIEAANEATLTTLLALSVITGKVQVTGPTVSLGVKVLPNNVTLVVPNAQTLTVTGAISGGSSVSIINNNIIVLDTGGTISGVSGTITNTSKTIKTSSATELANLLPKLTGGTVEASGAELSLANDATVPGGVTLKLAASTKLTVPEDKTLTLGASGDGGAATLTLTDANSKLVLLAGGKVSAANPGSTIIKAEGSETGVTVTVAGTDGNAKVESDEETPPTWTVSDDTTGTDISSTGKIILGGITLDFIGTAAVTNDACATTETDDKAAGSLEAGDGTTITFAGAN
jgi:hypothetical protein